MWTYDLETFSFLTNERVRGNTIIVKEHSVRIDSFPAHLLNFLQLKARRILVEVNEEDR